MQNPPTQNDAQKTTNFHAKRSTLEDKAYDICSTYQNDSCFTEAKNSIAFISQDSGTKNSLLLTIYHKFKTKLQISMYSISRISQFLISLSLGDTTTKNVHVKTTSFSLFW